MDVNLPGRNGYECVSILKPKPELLFIMCTSSEDDENYFNSLKAELVDIF
jgi:CheY-like chemotaxis protein